MKVIEVSDPYNSKYKETLGYLLEDEFDILKAIDLEKRKADLDHYDAGHILNNELREYGPRPTTFPTIAVFEASDEHNYLGVRYVTKDMFD